MRVLVSSAAVLCLVVGSLSAIGGQEPTGLPSSSPPQIPTGVPAGAAGSPAVPLDDSLVAKPGGEDAAKNDERFDCVLLVRDNEILLLSETQWEGKPIVLDEMGANLSGRKRVLVKVNANVPMKLVQRIAEAITKAGAEVTLRSQSGADGDSRKLAATADMNATQMKIFPLQFARSSELAETLRQLFASEVSKGTAVFAFDASSNSLIVRSDDENLTFIEALVLALDTRAASDSGVTGSGAPESTKAALPGSDRSSSDTGSAGVPAGRIEQLTGELTQIEQQLVKLSGQVREMAAKSSGFDDVTRKELERGLREQVHTAFDTRQRLQRAELVELRQRLSRIEQQIASRDRIKEEIIDSRVQELLEPARSGATEAAQNPPASNRQKPGETVATLDFPGWSFVPVNAKELASYISNPKFRGGLKVIAIQDMSPAAHSMIRLNDILVGLGKWETTSLANVDYALHHSPDRLVPFVVIRDGSLLQGMLELKFSSDAVTPAQLPDGGDSAAQPNPAGTAGQSGGTVASFDTRSSLILRTPSEFQKALADAEAGTAEAQLAVDTRLDELRSKNVTGDIVNSATIEDLKRRHPSVWKALESAGARLQLVRDEYATQMKLLELELKSAEQILETTHGQHDVSKTLYEAGRIGSIDMLRAKLEWDSATARVDRAKTLLELYRKLDTNPDSKVELPVRAEKK